VITGDAAQQRYADGTVFLLVNPFGEVTLRRVLANIRASLDDAPRAVRFAYLNPVHESVFQQVGWLRHVVRYRPLFYKTEASFWSADARTAFDGA